MRRRSILLGLVLVVTAVAACGGCADDSADDQLPSITFDGTTAVYSGPSEVTAYPPGQTFRLVNDSDSSVDFLYAPVKPDESEGVTEQDAIDWGLSNVGPPPWVGNAGYFASRVAGGETIETDATLIAGNTYELVVWKPSTSTGHFAAWIDAVAADDQ